jgi:hypothetical protein
MIRLLVGGAYTAVATSGSFGSLSLVPGCSYPFRDRSTIAPKGFLNVSDLGVAKLLPNSLRRNYRWGKGNPVFRIRRIHTNGYGSFHQEALK